METEILIQITLSATKTNFKMGFEIKNYDVGMI